MFLEGPNRHVHSTVRCSSVPAVACILAKARLSLHCTAGWSAVCNCTFPLLLGSTIAHAPLGVLMRLGARRLLADEGWLWAPSIRKHRNASLLLQRCVDHSLASSSR